MGGKTEKKTSAVKKSSAKNSKASKPEPKQKISKTATKTAKKTTAVKKSAAKEKVPVKKIPALKKSEIKKESNVVSKTPDVSVVKASAKPVALKSKDYGDDKIIHLDALEHPSLKATRRDVTASNPSALKISRAASTIMSLVIFFVADIIFLFSKY